MQRNLYTVTTVYDYNQDTKTACCRTNCKIYGPGKRPPAD